MFYKLKQVVLMLATLKHLVALGQPISDAVKLFESPGNGAAKKNAVMAMIKNGLEVAESAFKTDIPEDKIMGFVSGAIDIVVDVYNITGAWRKGAVEVTP